jgi:hypothetical protein
LITKEGGMGAEMQKLRQAIESWPMNLWRMATIFFFGCFVISILCYLLLETTYMDAKILACTQQTEIIDVQSSIIRQQSQIIKELTGDNTIITDGPNQPRLPVY